MMKRLIYTLALLLGSLGVQAQTAQPNLPSGSERYSQTLWIAPDSSLWTGKSGNYTRVATNKDLRDLAAQGYTRAQVDSAITANLAGYVPTSRTVNGKALTGNIALNAGDVGALESGDNISELVNDAGYITSGDIPAAPVTSVNGKTGAVTVTASDVGLGNVDNTSDLNKPISTATQSALNDKEDKSNKVTSLSSPNNTTYPTSQAVRTAIDASIPDVSLFVNKWETWDADFRMAPGKSLYFPRTVDGNNIVRQYMVGAGAPQKFFIDNTSGSSEIWLRVNAGGGLYNSLSLTNTDLVSTVPISAPNLNVFTRSMIGLVPSPGGSGTTRYLREDGSWVVPSGGGGGTATDLSIQNRNSTTLQIGSSTGSNATVPAATQSLAGLLTAVDKTKLDGISGDYLPITGGNLSGMVTSTVGRTVAGLGNTLYSQYHIQDLSNNTNDWFGWSVRAQAVGGSHTHAGAIGFIGTTSNNSNGNNGMDFAIYKRTGDGNSQIFRVSSAGTVVTPSHGNSGDWLSAYNYSQIGHLPLSGGVVSSESAVPLFIARLGANQVNLGFNHTGLSRFVGVDSGGDLRFGSNQNTANNNLVWHAGNLNPSDYLSISNFTWANLSGKPSTFTPSAHTHNASDINAGTLAIARIPTGTTGSTVALGNHTHTFASLTSKPATLAGYGITDGVPTSRTLTINGTTYNLSENRSWTLGASDVGAEPAFSKNTAFNKNFGTAAGTVAQGNDSRIVNAAQRNAANTFSGANTFSQPVVAPQYQGTSTTASSSIPTNAQSLFTASVSSNTTYTLTNMTGNPRHIQVIVTNTSGSDVFITFNGAKLPVSQSNRIEAGYTAIFTFLVNNGSAYGTKTTYAND